jgi:hypothetical protein
MNKRTIVAIVGRDASVRDFHVAHTDKMVIVIVTDNIAKESRLHTNESCFYFGASEQFAARETIRNSSGEYVRGDVHHKPKVTLEATNAARRNLSALPQNASALN